MHCSIARSLDVIGESWSLLILRDIYQGSRRFDELQKDLGIATNVLTARLNRLVDEGILEARRYQEHPPRYEYVPTEKGRELGPVLMFLVQWGNKWLSGSKEPQQAIVHNGCGHVGTPRIVCTHCGEAIGKHGVSIVPISKAKAVSAAVRKRAAGG
jgi:DNA-binding HxlR family transcriptional regulator